MTLPRPDLAFAWSSEAWGPVLRCAPLAASAQHWFTSKQRRLQPQLAAAAASLGASPDQVMRVNQVHGSVVRVLQCGAVPAGAALDRPDGDAIVSNQPGLILAVMVADCVPILLADRESGAAAAVHAGWRGTCARVAAAAVDGMARNFGTKPNHLIAAIGPSIGPDDYEVGESLVESFLQARHGRADVDRWFSRDCDKPHLDLWSANRDQLIAAGLDPAHILTCGLSTPAHPEVFDSYRREGDRAGRMAALIRVPAPHAG